MNAGVRLLGLVLVLVISRAVVFVLVLVWVVLATSVIVIGKSISTVEGD